MFRRDFLMAIVGSGVWLMLVGCASLKVWGPSDEERVSQVMLDLKAGWEAKDPDRILACYSPAYTYSDGSGIERLEELARGLAESPEVNIKVLLDEMDVSVEKGVAYVRGVRSEVTGPAGESKFGLRFNLREEEGKWLIIWSDAWSIE